VLQSGFKRDSPPTGQVCVKFLNDPGSPMTMTEHSLVVFQDKRIRRTWFNEEWWFKAFDIRY
jgi:hypothetical protein